MTMKIRIITTNEELEALQERWNALLCSNAEIDLPFYSWEWFALSWKHFGKPQGKKLYVIVAEEESEPPLSTSSNILGILPFVISIDKRGLLSYRVLEFCNTGMTPRNTLFCASSINFASVADAIFDFMLKNRRDWDVLNLANVLESSPFHDYLLQSGVNLEKLSLIQTKGNRSPYIKLTGNMEQYLQTLDKKVRYNIKRYVKSFCHTVDCSIKLFQKKEESDNALDFVFDVRKHSWKGEFKNPKYEIFYREITPLLFAKNQAIILIAFREETPIGAVYRLQNNGVFFGCTTDFDMRHKQLSPGVVLFYYLLEYIVLVGGIEFDFCGTDYDYKKQYTELERHHSTFQLFHSGLKSRLIFSLKTTWLPFIRKMFGKPLPDDFILSIAAK